MELTNLIIGTLKESIIITLIIFVLMIIVELFVLKYKERIIAFAKNNKFIGYILSSSFGSIPGCVGTFAMDSLYMAGLLSFGGIIAAMIATSGDEMLMMISMVVTGKLAAAPIISLVAILFGLGIIGGYLADFVLKKYKLSFCANCDITNHKHEEFKLKHFFKEHIYNHIIKKHIWQIFVWIFAAIFVIDLVKPLLDTSVIFAGSNMFYILIIAALVGILPISGPNVFLVIMFSQGLIPFSILLTNSIIQDGHGLLPIIGFSLDDAVKIKVFNFVFGLVIGIALLSMGF